MKSEDALLTAFDGGRSPYGERGLKYRTALSGFTIPSRSPYGERGLKFDRDNIIIPVIGRSPYGERGLKLPDCVKPSGMFLVALLTESVD